MPQHQGPDDPKKRPLQKRRGLPEYLREAQTTTPGELGLGGIADTVMSILGLSQHPSTFVASLPRDKDLGRTLGQTIDLGGRMEEKQYVPSPSVFLDTADVSPQSLRETYAHETLGHVGEDIGTGFKSFIEAMAARPEYDRESSIVSRFVGPQHAVVYDVGDVFPEVQDVVGKLQRGELSEARAVVNLSLTPSRGTIAARILSSPIYAELPGRESLLASLRERIQAQRGRK